MLAQRLYSTLLLLERTAEGKISKSNLSLISAATRFDEPIEGVITTFSTLSSSDASYSQLKKLFVIQDAKTPEEMSDAILNLKTKFNRIIGLHSSWGKSIIPRIAASLDAACLTDALVVDQGGTIIKRPIYAGRIPVNIRKCNHYNPD
jgi:electron transfer flavoprotein alpha subunit